MAARCIISADCPPLLARHPAVPASNSPPAPPPACLHVPALPFVPVQNVRVVQPNLVYAVGLSLDICQEEALRDTQYFGQFGRAIKISVNRSNQFGSALARHGPTGSAYVTFKRPEGEPGGGPGGARLVGREWRGVGAWGAAMGVC